MSKAAKKDECSEKYCQRPELGREVSALSQEDPDCGRDGKIGREDKNVRYSVQSNQPGLPQEAIAMSHVSGLIDQVLKHGHNFPLIKRTPNSFETGAATVAEFRRIYAGVTGSAPYPQFS
jgi:hypothetical protein